ncbi:MAG TPA: hypothetical protein VK745_31145 [Polyangiaceae bacterium]|nr:hypothetical protein [Polyangiaceae bacterium]
MHATQRAALVGFWSLLCACGVSHSPATTDAGTDAGTDASTGTDASSDAGTEADADAAPPPPTVAAMLEQACPGGACTSDAVVTYWKSYWQDLAVQRTLRFVESGPTAYSFTVTDADGNPATLDFAAGIPVTLTVTDDGTSTSAEHYLAAPALSRSVAWYKVDSVDGEYDAPNFDAVGVLHTPGVANSMSLYFVPLLSGSYDAYCRTGVTMTSAGPDLTTGHAGLGMKTTVTVDNDLGVTLDQGLSPTYDPSFDQDPRRDESNAVWASGALDTRYSSATGPVVMDEQSKTMFMFTPDEVDFKVGVGTDLGLINVATDKSRHYFTSPDFLVTTVFLKTQDTQGEVFASYLTSFSAKPGKNTDMFLVPTIASNWQFYCMLGVKPGADGGPDLTTGHAGLGMVGQVVVSQ